MAKRRLSETDLERMAEMREAGRSFAVIGKVLNCSGSAVSFQCLKLGIEPPKPAPCWDAPRGPIVTERNGYVVRRFTPAEDAELLALEAQRLSRAEIGRRIGRKPNVVTGRLMTLARREARREMSDAA